MTIRKVKIAGAKKLLRFSGKSAALESELLLADTLGVTREEMIAHDDRNIPARSLARFRSLIARRARHEPIAYLLGRKEFYGLDFFVNKNVLIPRPETELMVELALTELLTTNYKLLVDVGTGSGAIAIAVAKNALNVTVIATDTSARTLKIATRNAVVNDVADRIVFKKGDLLSFLSFRGRENVRTPILITANLPYLSTAQWRKTAPDVKRFEPRGALVPRSRVTERGTSTSTDGLDAYDRLFDQIASRFYRSPTSVPKWDFGKITILIEIDPGQKRKIIALIKRHLSDATVEIHNDLAELARVVKITYGT